MFNKTSYHDDIWEVEVQFHAVLTSGLDESDGSGLCPGSSTMISVMSGYQAG